MDFLKVQLTRIQEQLAGLTATQKMLVISMLTIMVMTLVWWSHWAAEPEMSPLMDNQALSAENIAQINTTLSAQGIPHELNNGTVYVPADRKLEIMSILGYSNALPQNFEGGFESIVKEMNWLDPPDKTKEMFLRAKEQTLKEMMRRFPGVRDAEVVIDDSMKENFDGAEVQPVAAVTILSDPNQRVDNRKLAESAANMVCGSEGGLKRSNVRVVIDGRSYELQDKDDAADNGDDALTLQKSAEDDYQKKIEHLLQDIQGVIVSVTVKVDTSETETTIHKIDPKQTVSVETSSEQTTQEQDGAQAAAQEPGAVPNTSMSLPAASSGGGGGSNNSTEKDTFSTDFNRQDEVVKQGAGTVSVVGASVRIPRSYFVQTYKRDNGGKDPDDPAVLNAYINTQLTQIHDQVKGCAPFPNDDALFVGTFTDLPPAELPQGEDTMATSPIAGTVTRHGKELAVGALAAISLFMVSMMVRKGAPAPGASAGGVAEAIVPDAQALVSGDTVVGSATEDAATLDGMELDTETVKSQRMQEQVTQMVQSNPDAAANLVKRWLNR